MVSPQNRVIALRDLKASGLDSKDIKKLKIKFLGTEETSKLLNKDMARLESIAFPYFNLDGSLSNYYRCKLLMVASGLSKNSELSGKKYDQKSGTIPRIYFPPYFKWDKLAADSDEPLIITEGEKKSACACKLGYPTMGLGGVDSWTSKKRGITPVLEEIDKIDWVGRVAYICFDNDCFSNEGVNLAAKKLAAHLVSEGAIVYRIMLPENGPKGLDDYLTSFKTTKQSKAKFDKLVEEAQEYPCSEAIREVNKTLALCTGMSAYINHVTKDILPSRQAASDLVNKTRFWNPDNTKGDIFKFWLSCVGRKEYKNIVYTPGEGKEVDGCLNFWNGWGVEPKRGTVYPFFKFLEHLIPSKEEREYLLQWIAYPMQNPGAKMTVAVAIFSHTKGTGKTFLGQIIKDIYGENGGKITQTQLESGYNDWSVNKQFLIGDEIVGQDKRQYVALLKEMITQEEVSVSKKYTPYYTIKDTINYYFTGNEPDMVYIEDGDRRFYAPTATEKRLEFHKELNTWRLSEGGLGALFHYFLHKVDCSNFDPQSAPINTAAKEQMKYYSRSDLDQFCAEFIESPSTFLESLEEGSKLKDWYSVEEIRSVANKYLGGKEHTKIAVSKSMRRQGLLPKVIKVEDVTKLLWCVHNEGLWRRKAHAAIASNYVGSKVVGSKLVKSTGKVVDIRSKRK